MSEIIMNPDSLHEVCSPLNLSEEVKDGSETKEIINKLKDALLANPDIKAISAPQIGIKKRVFCINFNGEIKTFINPVITKKLARKAIVETCASMLNKEYLVIRPTEICAVYFTEQLKYEDNKFIGGAASIFDQQVQLLDGVIPADIGLESDINEDGSLADATDEEMHEYIEILKKVIQARLTALKQDIEKDHFVKVQYDNLRFSEQVIDDTITVVDQSVPKLNREQRRALAKKNKKKGCK